MSAVLPSLPFTSTAPPLSSSSHTTSVPARQHQRGVADLALQVDRRALVEQQLHHLRVAFVARPHQRGPAPLVLHVDRRALVEQQPHHLRVAVPARQYQRGVAVFVLLVDRRALGK